MSQIDELLSISKNIRKYNLPMSPILEYAINEKCEKLASLTDNENNQHATESVIINRIREEIMTIVENYDSVLTLFVEFDPSKGLVVRKQPIQDVEDSSGEMNKEDDLILTHSIDWSPFEYGFTIDKKFHEAVFKAVGNYIPRGSGVDIKVLFQGKVFDAKITNADSQGRKGDTIRLLYKGKNNTLGSYLKEVLPEVYNYIKNFKEKNGGRKPCPLPSDLRRQLVMNCTENNGIFNMIIKAS